MGIYSNYITESTLPINEAVDYISYIKKYKVIIKDEANNSSKEVFELFIDKMKKKDHYKDDIDDFVSKNKKPPVVLKIESDDTDLYVIYLNTKGSDDMILFYQDEVVKYLNKNKELKDLGFYFSTEDYPGIYIYKK